MSALDPRKLETFRVVASLGSISAASRQLHLSQPAVTAQIRQLEQMCGKVLFQRTPQGMRLNGAGQALLVYARRMRTLLEEAELSLSEDAEREGDLLLGASTTVAAHVLPPVLQHFLASRPRTGVRVWVGNTEEVLKRVKASRLPLGLVEGPVRAPGIRLEHYLDDELLPVISANLARDLHSQRALSDLEQLRILWREPGSGSRAMVERALRKAGSARRQRRGDLELGSTGAILQAVILGLGLGFLSRWSAARALADGQIRTVTFKGLRVQRAFSWVLPGGEVGGMAARFLEQARRTPPLP